MKRNVFIFILAAEAVVCVLLTVFKASLSAAFSAVIAFPFEQIGLGLRALSLSGTAGNVLAFLLYIVICLIPTGALFFIRRKRILQPEDGLLPVVSIVLFAAVYFMINPGLIEDAMRSIPVGKAIFGGTVYSVVLAYFVLRILRLFRAGSLKQLPRYLSVLLGLLNVVFVYLIFGAGIGTLMEDISTLQAGNSGYEHLLGASYVFAVLQYLVDALPYVFDILIVFAGIKLLGNMTTDRYSGATVSAASKLSTLCTKTLSITVLAIAFLNLLQLLFAKHLFNIHAALQIPLLSIAFVLAALLLSRLVAENKTLKEENDSII